MTISFNSVPSNTRIPFAYIEYDNTNAQQGPSIQDYTVLAIGQKLSGGSKDALEPIVVSSEEQAREYFGAGSQLFTMLKHFFAANKSTRLVAIPVDDDASGVASSGNVLFAGTATDSGVIYFYVAGTRYTINVTSGDDAADVCAALVAEINDDDDRIVTAAVNGSTPEQMDLTARNKGVFGNEIDLRFNYYEGEETVDGITYTITSMASGATNPDIADVIAVLDDTHYNVVLMPWSDTSNLNTLKTELDDRFGPERQLEGMAFSAKRGSYSSLITYGDARNSKTECIMGVTGPSSPWDWAAQVGAVAAKYLSIDPARPIQRLELPTILPPSTSERFTNSERNLLLYDGISTFNVVGTTVQVERLISTWQTNSSGAADESYLRVETFFTLSYLRYDLRTDFVTKFPRHKLADDGTRFGPGQAVLTPKIARGYFLTKFRQWETLALVEGFDQFKNDLVVERNGSNPDRLDVLLGPDLVNQMRVLGAQIQFLL